MENFKSFVCPWDLSLTSSRVLVFLSQVPPAIKYSGKQGINLRIVQVYCPPTPCPLSHNSTYTQQHRYFLNSQIDECPRTLFLQHLSQFLQLRFQAQEQIILMGDLNHIVDSPQILPSFNNITSTTYTNLFTPRTTRIYRHMNVAQELLMQFLLLCTYLLLPAASFPLKHSQQTTAFSGVIYNFTSCLVLRK